MKSIFYVKLNPSDIPKTLTKNDILSQTQFRLLIFLVNIFFHCF